MKGSQTTEKGSRRRKILIVEDEGRIAEWVRVCCEDLGYECEIAPDGIRAEKLLRRSQYSLILMDVVFFRSDFVKDFIRKKGYRSKATRDGIDLIRTIRQRDGNTPIIVMTAYGPEVAQEAIGAGANGFLLKPFEIAELKGVIGTFVKA